MEHFVRTVAGKYTLFPELRSGMRQFYLMAYEDQDDPLAVVAYQTASFGEKLFLTGEPFQRQLPSDLKLLVSQGHSSDFLPNPRRWPIVSDGLFRIISHLPGDYEVFDAPLQDVDSGQRVLGYKILNVTRLQPADLEYSKVRPMKIMGKQIIHILTDGFAFRESSIPPHVHLFRAVQDPSLIAISGELANAMSAADCMKGIELIPTKTV